jgi:hypothetical protein
MPIQSNLAAPGLIRKRAISSSGTVIPWPGIPLLVKVATMVVLSLMLIIFSVLNVARTGTISKILGPPRPYLPGNSLPLLPKVAECNHFEDDIISCIVHELGQDVYVSYEKNTRMIVHTGLKTNESKIGELIVAWGLPSGFNQYDDSIFVYWGTRSAVLYTTSFRPESRVEFIQYDLDEQPASAWRGFRPL